MEVHGFYESTCELLSHEFRITLRYLCCCSSPIMNFLINTFNAFNMIPFHTFSFCGVLIAYSSVCLGLHEGAYGSIKFIHMSI